MCTDEKKYKFYKFTVNSVLWLYYFTTYEMYNVFINIAVYCYIII